MNTYRSETIVSPEQYKEVVEGNPIDIKGVLTNIAGMIRESRAAVVAINRFMFGDEPVSMDTREEPKCFADELRFTMDLASELVEVAAGLCKRLGA